MLFDIRVIAFDPHAAEDPVDALMRVFRVERAVARELVVRLPRVIKRDVPIDSARRFCQVLEQVGATVELVGSASRVRPAHEGAPARTRELRQPGLPSFQGSPLVAVRTPAGASTNAAAQLLTHERRPSRRQQESLAEAPRLREDQFSLPEPREPDPFDSDTDIDGIVERALVEVHVPRSLEPPLSSETTGIIRAEARRSAGRSSQADVTSSGLESFDQPARLRESRAELDAGSFRAARPVLEFDPAPVAAPVRPEPVAAPYATHSPSATKATLHAAPAFVRAPLVLPAFTAAGSSVQLDHVQRQVQAAVRKYAAATWLILLGLTVVSLGALLGEALLALAWDSVRRWRRVRAIEASAIAVGPAQLGELHECARQFAQRLGLLRSPRLFVGKGSRSLVTAVSFGREIVLLIDGPELATHVRAGTAEVLSFALAHELSRHALRQNRRFPALLAWLWPAVRKSFALSADAAATQLLPDPSIAERSLLALLVGADMAGAIDCAELGRQAESHARNTLGHAAGLDGGRGMLLTRLHHLQHGRQGAQGETHAP